MTARGSEDAAGQPYEVGDKPVKVAYGLLLSIPGIYLPLLSGRKNLRIVSFISIFSEKIPPSQVS